MKINRLMQMIFVSASVCAALPAFAASERGHEPAPHPRSSHPGEVRCGDDGDDGGGDGDDGDGDDGDDGDAKNGTETIEL